MTIAQTETRQTRTARPKKIPDALICEIMDGKPLYYKGYQDVLTGKKKAAEIMGSSSLQAFIVSYLMKCIYSFIDDDAYTVLVSEPGVHLDRRDDLSNDIAIFDQNALPGSKISRKYADVPPKIVVEVDIDADVTELTETGYIHKKTRKLLAFGVEKIIWVLTETQAVLVATTERTEILDWNRDLELMDGHLFNIGAQLKRKGITLD